jgi:hypothetical protein
MAVKSAKREGARERHRQMRERGRKKLKKEENEREERKRCMKKMMMGIWFFGLRLNCGAGRIGCLIFFKNVARNPPRPARVS